MKSALSPYLGEFHKAPVELLTHENLIEELDLDEPPFITEFKFKALIRIPQETWTVPFLKELSGTTKRNSEDTLQEVIVEELAKGKRLDILAHIPFTQKEFDEALGRILMALLVKKKITGEVIPPAFRPLFLEYTKALQTKGQEKIREILERVEGEKKLQELKIRHAREAGVAVAQAMITSSQPPTKGRQP